MFDTGQLEEFVARGATWAAARSALLHDTGWPLTSRAVERLAPYFHVSTLRRIRVVPVPSIPSPGFGAIGGLTLADTVLVSTRRADLAELAFERLLFHEAVHVVQYGSLGVSRFLREYVVGWARSGFSYEAIPLERQAYALDARFARGEPCFSVEREVAAWLDARPSP